MRKKTNKTTRAAALALLAGPGVACTASAASSVTLYGIADAGFGHSRYPLNQGEAQVSSSHNGLRSGYRDKSRLGLRDSEDLGGGLGAVFQLEQGIKLEDGRIKNGFDRLAFVGLRGDSWGTFTMGRQKGIADSFTSIDTVKSLGKDSRRDSLFKCVSPSFAGLRGGLAYARESGSSGGTDHFYSAGLLYKSGPMRLSAVYGHEKQAGAGYAVRNRMLAGKYDFKAVKLVAAWGQDRSGKFITPVGLGSYNQQGFQVKQLLPRRGRAGRAGHARADVGTQHVQPGPHGRVLPVRVAGHLRRHVQLPAVQAHPPVRVRRLGEDDLAYIRGFKGREAGLGINHKF